MDANQYIVKPLQFIFEPIGNKNTSTVISEARKHKAFKAIHEKLSGDL